MRLAIGLLAVTAFAQDAATTLEQARSKVLAATSNLAKYVCVETIDRSYYSRTNQSDTPSSCERMALDRKRGQDRLQLDKTDRLRVAVEIAQGREIYSWTGSAPDTHGVENILNGGPIGTGPFAVHLLDIFTNPAVRFRLLSEPSNTLDYGFRVPVGASRFLVLGQRTWLPAGYSGSVRIDRDSLDVKQVTVETDELPAETTMCEERTALEFREPNRFLPAESRTHDVLRDATETDRVTTISDCHEAPATRPLVPRRLGEPLPKDLRLSLTLDSDIDSDVAAAGDAISATVALPVITYGRAVAAGAKVTGRIVYMGRQHAPKSAYLIAIAFDTLEQKGSASPFYAKLIGPNAALEMPGEIKLTGHGIEDWPHGMFGFPAAKRQQRYVVPAGFESRWVTVALEDLK
jgi:hypothetical protein